MEIEGYQIVGWYKPPESSTPATFCLHSTPEDWRYVWFSSSFVSHDHSPWLTVRNPAWISAWIHERLPPGRIRFRSWCIQNGAWWHRNCHFHAYYPSSGKLVERIVKLAGLCAELIAGVILLTRASSPAVPILMTVLVFLFGVTEGGIALLRIMT